MRSHEDAALAPDEAVRGNALDSEPAAGEAALDSDPLLTEDAVRSETPQTGSEPSPVQETLEATNGGSTTVPRHEEELRIEKLLEEYGALYITKDVTEEPRAVDVPVRNEELNVSRRVVERRVDGPVRVYEEGDSLIIPIVEERLEVRKVAYVVEELIVDRVVREETRTVSDTVRKEQITIEQEGQLRTEQR